jgi:hypothetical protein
MPDACFARKSEWGLGRNIDQTALAHVKPSAVGPLSVSKQLISMLAFENN